MSKERILVRITLVVAALFAISAIVGAVLSSGFASAETWAVIAAALAVITSTISSWPAQRALELQQDQQLPYPYPTLDIRSRYGLMMLRVTNYGESVAVDIRLRWNRPLLNEKGELVRFTDQEEAPDIPALPPNESVAILIGRPFILFEKYEDMSYSGEVEFKDASGNKRKHAFYLSAEAWRKSPTHDEEELKTHYQIQKIPDEIGRLRRELEYIKFALGDLQPQEPDSEETG